MAPPLSDMADSPSDHGTSARQGVPPIEYRWKPGESGNPGGRPSRKPLTDAIRKLLDMDRATFETYEPATVAEQMALDTIRNAKTDPRFATHMYDRAEGKVADTVHVEGGPQPLQIVLAEAVRPVDQPDAESNTRDPAQSGDQS